MCSYWRCSFSPTPRTCFFWAIANPARLGHLFGPPRGHHTPASEQNLCQARHQGRPPLRFESPAAAACATAAMVFPSCLPAIAPPFGRPYQNDRSYQNDNTVRLTRGVRGCIALPGQFSIIDVPAPGHIVGSISAHWRGGAGEAVLRSLPI